MNLSYRDHTLAAVLVAVLASPSFAHADDNQTRTVGPQTNGTIVASDNQLLTPAGTTVDLGSPARAKAVAINPNRRTRSGAVLLMGASESVIVFDTKSGQVLQRYLPVNAGSEDSTGSFTGITYTSDGSKLLFSQDDNYVSVAAADPFTGKLTQAASITLPSPPPNPKLYDSFSADPGGIALVGDQVALVALSANNCLGVIDLNNDTLISQIPVGNAPNRVVVKGDFAYVSNEGGRPATASDFTDLSDGTPIVVDPLDAFAITGTVSVIDLRTGKLTGSIGVGLHPAGMAISGSMLYVANSYSDTISVIDTDLKKVVRTIKVGVPIKGGAFGAGANDVAVVGTTAFVTLGESNAIAVVDLTNATSNSVVGFIPTLYFPTTIAYDAEHRQLVVSNDKGTGAQGSIGSAEGAESFNTHQDTGTVSLIPIPDRMALARMTRQVVSNNAWASNNIEVGPQYADSNAAPVAVPAHIGEPSLIKHVFLIVKENRTYDQMIGDLRQANGDPSIAVFAPETPNQHALVKRFPLLDNMYAPSRQSADGHPWIMESGSFYSNDILSSDWIRGYPGGNQNDALTYTPQRFLWSAATARGLSVRLYGEWSTGQIVKHKPDGTSYSWADFYNTTLYKETDGVEGANVVPDRTDSESSVVPSAQKLLDPHYPSINLTIPDQYRMDYYIPILQAQDRSNTVPNLTILWLSDDHTAGTTTGEPLPANYIADNDLALGRLVEAVTKTHAWASTAIFVEEDDSQDGVDHVDGHRQPVYVISPYTVPPQSAGVGQVIHTTYTQENINRTIENILGMQPLTQFDLVASPMFDCFQNTPNLEPFTHVPSQTPLNIGPGGTPIPGTGGANYATRSRMNRLEKAWNEASNRVMRPNLAKADVVDENFLNHVIWYSATGWKRPYPGDRRMLWPSAFKAVLAGKTDDE